LAASTTKPTVTIKGPEIMALMIVPLKAEEPNGEEVELAQATAPPAAELPATLPKTASTVPLIGLMGLLSLGAAFTMRFAASRVK
jgi:hypothetical protein